MAVKKSKAKPSNAPASLTKAPKKAAAKKAAAPKAAAKAAAPKATGAKKTAPKKKAAAPVKLTDNQAELLKKVHGTGDVGHPAVSKADTKSLEALKDKKLIKKGKKNKDTGHVHYHVSKAGGKHVDSSSNPTS